MAFAGLAPGGSAHAAPVTPQAGDASISGTVELPSGATAANMRLWAYQWKSLGGLTGWMFAASGVVSKDGSFIVPGLDAGVEYRLEIGLSGVAGTNAIDGFYTGPGKPLGYRAVDGLGLRPPVTGLALQLEDGGEISGTFTVPEGVDVDEDRVVLAVFDTTYGSEGQAGPWESPWWAVGAYGLTSSGPRTFEYLARGIRKDVPHAVYLYVLDDDSFADGYLHLGSDGTVLAPEHATRVFAGDDFDAVLTGRRAAPRLAAYVAPRLEGEAVVGEQLSIEAARWSMPITHERRTWLRDGEVIPGAEGVSYTLTAADLGKQVSARVTASSSGFPQVAVETEPSSAVRNAPADPADPAAPADPEDPADPGAPPLVATAAPKVSGTARLGKSLRASRGSWDAKGVSVSYQWLRSGKPITGARSARYTLRKNDVGKKVSVRVTARAQGRAAGVASSATLKVAKGKPTVTVNAPKTVKAGKRAKLTVRVKLAGIAKPTGTVRVKYGKKTVKVTLKAAARGKVTVRLPRLAQGRHKISVRYSPSAKTKKYVSSASSKTVLVRVR